MIIIDSTVWVSYFAGESSPTADRLERALVLEEDVATLVDSIPEVIAGYTKEATFRTIRGVLLQMPIVEAPISARVDAATLKRRARQKRLQVKRETSFLLAQACEALGASLLTSHDDMARLSRIASFQIVAV